MAQHELEIEIDPTGKVTVTTKGIKGPACLDVVKALALVIGREESHELTPEYYEAHVTSQSGVRQHQGR